jgi:ferritin
MITNEMELALNTQVNAEFAAASTYLSMAAHCEANHLPGVAHWLMIQAKEELAHAMRFYDHIITRGGRVRLRSVAGPFVDFRSTVDIFEQAVQNEQQITGMIHNLYALATESKDFASQPFLSAFIIEQVEEEDLANATLAMAKMVGSDPGALLLFDLEMAKRGA